MTTDKDREEAKIICSAIKIPIELSIGGLKIVTTVSIGEILAKMNSDTIAQILYGIRAESVDQARKEAAERAVRFFDDFRICVPPNKYNMPQETLEQLRSAILGDTVKEGKTDAEKLDIAVKALEKINERHSFADIVDDSYTISRDALREIQA